MKPLIFATRACASLFFLLHIEVVQSLIITSQTQAVDEQTSEQNRSAEFSLLQQQLRSTFSDRIFSNSEISSKKADAGAINPGNSSKRANVEFASAYERKLGLTEDTKHDLIKTFRSLTSQEKSKLCKEPPLGTNEIFKAKIEPLGGNQNDVFAFVHKLCSVKGAGFEVEIRMFPCVSEAFGELIYKRQYKLAGKTLPIRNCLHDKSIFRLNFSYNPNHPFDLGYDVTSDYYNKLDWQSLKIELENHPQIGPFYMDDVPNKNYEFRTFGKLDKETFEMSQDAFANWYNPLVDEFRRQLAANSLPSLSYFPYNNNGRTIFICLAKEKRPKSQFFDSDILYKPQITFAFDIADLKKVIGLITGKPELMPQGLFLKYLSAFLNGSYQQPILEETSDNRCYLSGMEYLSKFDWKGLLSDKFLPFDFVHQVDFLKLLGAMWFKKMGDEEISKICEDINQHAGTSLLKAYTYFMPRISEKTILSSHTIEHVLARVAPFFDIYLPFEVVPILDKLDGAGLNELLNGYLEFLDEYEKKYGSNDNITKGKEYINYVRITMFEPVALDPHPPPPRIKVDASFRLSFSLYLWIITAYPHDNIKLVINHFFEIKNPVKDPQAPPTLPVPLPTTIVKEDLETTLVLEYRSIPFKANNFGTLFDPLIEDFFSAL